MGYCLDTSSIIDSWCKHYRNRSFPSLWRNLEKAIEDGVLFSPFIVLDELTKRAPTELVEWAKDHPKLFHAGTPELQTELKRIINLYPKLIEEQRNRSMADPWVISLAKVSNSSVVSNETHTQKLTKMPDVCSMENIKYLNMADFLEHIGWTF